MEKTNKISIICPDIKERGEILQAVADILGIECLDVNDFILRGSVLNGDLENLSKDEFLTRYGETSYNMLETMSYIAYTTTVDAPFVILIENRDLKSNMYPLKKTISFSLTDKSSRKIANEIADYSMVLNGVEATAKSVAEAVLSDERWSNSVFIVK